MEIMPSTICIRIYGAARSKAEGEFGGRGEHRQVSTANSIFVLIYFLFFIPTQTGDNGASISLRRKICNRPAPTKLFPTAKIGVA